MNDMDVLLHVVLTYLSGEISSLPNKLDCQRPSHRKAISAYAPCLCPSQTLEAKKKTTKIQTTHVVQQSKYLLSPSVMWRLLAKKVA